MDNFEQAFRDLIGHEGGYVNHPRDPGGETKYGITKRTYPDINIKALTLDDAQAIYRRDFWNEAWDDLPYVVAFNLFDGAVNHGVSQSVRFMQRAAGVADDGKIGPVTLAALRSADPEALAARFNGYRLKFFSDLSTWPTFGKGWARRVSANLIEIKDGVGGDTTLAPPSPAPDGAQDARIAALEAKLAAMAAALT